MQALTRAKGKAVVYELFIFCETGSSQYIVSPVPLIVKQRMPDILHMYPNLVRTSGFKSALHQRNIPKSLENLIMSHRGFPLLPFREDTHEHAIFGVSANISFNGAFVLRHVTPHQCRVKPVGLFSEKLPREVRLGLGRLGHEQ